MKKILKISLFAAAFFSMVSCYEDYIKDYDYSATYFASQRPLRTVIADRGMTIEVGAAIGGKREVDVNDWVRFEVDPALLEGTSLTLLPENCYSFSEPGMMRISKSNLPIADVTVSFTDAFYELPEATGTYYALPLKLVDSSLDSILTTKNTSIVAIKYISTYHGTYYVQGALKTLDASGNVTETVSYNDSDLSQNITRSVVTVSRDVVYRQGLANLPTDDAADKVQMQMNPADKTVTVTSADGGIAITDGSGTFDDSGERLVINLSYRFTKDGVNYQVDETLTRRQDPLSDLRYEEW